MIPSALFTSTGLMLAAWTLIITSVSALTTGLGNWATLYPEGFEYAGMLIESILSDGACDMLNCCFTLESGLRKKGAIYFVGRSRLDCRIKYLGIPTEVMDIVCEPMTWNLGT